MISYRQYKILKSIKEMLDVNTLKEQEHNKTMLAQGGVPSNIANKNFGISDLKAIIRNKYSEEILIKELHELGELGYISIDSQNKNKVESYSLNITGKVIITDYWKNIIKLGLKNYIIPVVVSIVTSLIVAA